MSHSKETKKKISEGVRRSRSVKQVQKRRQAEADTILKNFKKGSNGKAATKVRRYAEQKEYSEVGEGAIEEKEITTLMVVPASKIPQVDEVLAPKVKLKPRKPELGK